MKQIILYLIVIFLLIVCGFIIYAQGGLPGWLAKYSLFYLCSLMGGLGGITYCLRGVYLNACVKKSWDTAWYPWYYIRPLVSILCGAISYLFLKAGLLVLEASQNPGASEMGFLALSFVAGLNVDRFLEKIEDIAQTTWGIKKSRTSTKEEDSAE